MSKDSEVAVLHKEALEVARNKTAATATGSGRMPLSQIQLSVVVTVFTETFSIRETVDTLLGRDRGYIHEIILLVSPRASEEAMAICFQCVAQDPRVKIVIQKNNPG